MVTPKWFTAEDYLKNKLATKAVSDAGITDLPALMVAFEKVGFAGEEGAYKHFQMYGNAEGISPNKYFNATQYLQAKAADALGSASEYNVGLVASAIAGLGMSAWDHYQKFGATEGKFGINPSNAFDQETYLNAKAALVGKSATEVKDAITKAGMTVLQHYMQFADQPGEVSLSTNVAVPADKQVGGTTGKTFTLTNSTDNIVGTSGNDTIVGDNVSTSAGDQINGGAGTDTLKLYGNAVKPAFSNVEKVYLNGNTAGFDVSTNSEVTNLDLDAVATAQTYTIANGQAVSVANVAATSVVDFAGNTVTALNVGLNGNGTAAGANDVQIDFNSTAQTSVAFTTSTKKSFIELLNTGAKLETVTIAGDQALSLESALTTVKTINASTATGDVTIAGVGASDLTFTGGSGNDKLVLGATLTAADTLKGGAGTDTLSISDADTMNSAAEVANVTEFEIFEAAAADGTTYDLSFLNAKNSLTGLVVSGAATVTVSNINAASTGNIKIVADTTTVLSATDFVSGGTSDTATITLDDSAAKTGNGIDVASLTFANLDVLNLVSKSDGTPTKTVGGAEENSIASLVATDLEKIVVTGDEAVAITTAAGTLPTEIDASGMTDAAVSIDTGTNSAIVSLLVKGTAKNDTIKIDNAATVTSTLYLGGGNDTVTVTGGGTGAHVLKFTAEALNSGDVKAGNVSTVTLTGAAAGDTITLDFTSAFEGLLKSGGTVLSAATGNVNIHGTALSSTTNIAAAQAGGNMVVQIDLNGDGAYNATDDYQITLVGTGTDDTLVYNAATDVFTFTVV